MSYLVGILIGALVVLGSITGQMVDAPTCWEDEARVIVIESHAPIVGTFQCAPVDDLTAGFRP
jgi:hypothetical protein